MGVLDLETDEGLTLSALWTASIMSVTHTLGTLGPTNYSFTASKDNKMANQMNISVNTDGKVRVDTTARRVALASINVFLQLI